MPIDQRGEILSRSGRIDSSDFYRIYYFLGIRGGGRREGEVLSLPGGCLSMGFEILLSERRKVWVESDKFTEGGRNFVAGNESIR